MDNKHECQSAPEEVAETEVQRFAPGLQAHGPNQPASSAEILDALQGDAFSYFLHQTNPANGLVADKTQQHAPASIAAVGFALRPVQKLRAAEFRFRMARFLIIR